MGRVGDGGHIPHPRPHPAKILASFPIAGKVLLHLRPCAQRGSNPRRGPNGNFYPPFFPILCDNYITSLG